MNESIQDYPFDVLPSPGQPAFSNTLGDPSKLEQGIRSMFTRMDDEIRVTPFPRTPRSGKKDFEEKNQEYAKTSAVYVLKLETIVKESYLAIAEHLQTNIGNGEVLPMEVSSCN
jgi:hypothetical protein